MIWFYYGLMRQSFCNAHIFITKIAPTFRSMQFIFFALKIAQVPWMIRISGRKNFWIMNYVRKRIKHTFSRSINYFSKFQTSFDVILLMPKSESDVNWTQNIVSKLESSKFSWRKCALNCSEIHYFHAFKIIIIIQR